MDLFRIFSIAYLFTQFTLSVSAVVLNGLFIVVLASKGSLHTPSNAVLGCLCGSDLLTGITSFVQWILFMTGSISSINDVTFIAVYSMFLVFSGLSFIFMGFIHLDRYAAICEPFKYLQYATSKLYIAISFPTCFTYVLMIGAAFSLDIAYNLNSFVVILTLIVGFATFTVMYCNLKIRGVIRRHRRQIASIRLNSNRHHSEFRGETKRYRITVILVILFVCCTLPPTIFYMFLFIRRVHVRDTLLLISMICDILLLLNSSLDPFVYYFSIKVFRTATIEILCCQRPGWFGAFFHD